MAELPGDFGDRLVAREAVDPMRMQQLREQITAVLEVRLSRPLRVATVALGAVLAAIAVATALLARRRWDELPAVAHAIAIAGPIGLLLTGAFMIGVARRGVFDRRYHDGQFLSVALLMCFGAGTAFLHAGWASGDSQLAYCGTTVLVLGGAAFVLYVLEQHHLATKRKLLELELRMAELAEQLNRPRWGGP